MRKFFKAETTVIPFKDIQAIGPTTEHDSGYETGIWVGFKDGKQIIFSSSKAEAQRLVDEFSAYLQGEEQEPEQRADTVELENRRRRLARGLSR
jgi:hypothetical protein